MAEAAVSASSGVDRPRLVDRILPRGPLDLILQLLIIAAAYYAWRYARGAVVGPQWLAFENARDLLAIERSLGLFFEPDLQKWGLEQGWVGDATAWGYANLHFRGSCLMLLLIYLLRPGSYPFVRNMVIAAMGISVLAYLAYPTAPPRFFEDLGFALSEEVTGNRPILSDPGNPLFNPFAAVPSMHVGLSMILAWSLAYLLRNPFAKVFFFLYPILMTYIVCATGNHWWLDAVFGALTALLALGVASAFAWANPRWALRVEKRLTSDHAETIAV